VKQKRQETAGRKELVRRARAESRQNSPGSKRHARQAREAPAKRFALNVPRKSNRTEAKDRWQARNKGLFSARNEGRRFR
jgi:hypothetical protein